MNRPKLIRIHTIKGLKGLREDTLRPSLSALRPCVPFSALKSFSSPAGRSCSPGVDY